MWNLTTNGLPESSILRAGSAAGRQETARWLSALPVVARPDARSMLVVGLGGGVVVERVPGPIESIDVIELEPQVVNANRAVAALPHERSPRGPAPARPRERRARGALQLADRRFDAIVSQPSHPWTAGASHLYTREFFELVKSRLAPGGVFSQWMGAQFVDRELLRILLATLLDVFPHVRVYASDLSSVVFLASDQPLDLETTAAAALAADPRAFAAAGIRMPEDVAARADARRGGRAPLRRRRRDLDRRPQLPAHPLPRAGARASRGPAGPPARRPRDREDVPGERASCPRPRPTSTGWTSCAPSCGGASSPRGLGGPGDPRSRAAERRRGAHRLGVRGEPGAVLAKARKAIEQDPASRDALAELVDLWRFGVQPGRDLARTARPAGDARAVHAGMERARGQGLRRPSRPSRPRSRGSRRPATRWPRRPSACAPPGAPPPATPPAPGRRLALLDALPAGILDRFDYLERARAAQVAGDSFGTLSSLQQILGRGDFAPPTSRRACSRMRARCCGAGPVEPEWEAGSSSSATSSRSRCPAAIGISRFRVDRRADSN